MSPYCWYSVGQVKIQFVSKRQYLHHVFRRKKVSVSSCKRWVFWLHSVNVAVSRPIGQQLLSTAESWITPRKLYGDMLYFFVGCF